VEVVATDKSYSKSSEATQFLLASLHPSKTLLKLDRGPRSIDGWHWSRDTQLNEDAYLYQSNGARVMARLRTAALRSKSVAGHRVLYREKQSHQPSCLCRPSRTQGPITENL
jgi:hypothetical protein